MAKPCIMLANFGFHRGREQSLDGHHKKKYRLVYSEFLSHLTRKERDDDRYDVNQFKKEP